jgi:hypothetical protein
MSLLTDPLEELISSRAVYIPDRLQLAIGSALSEEFAGWEPGDLLGEEVTTSPPSRINRADRSGEPAGDSERVKREETGRSIVFFHLADLHLGPSSSPIEGGTSMATPIVTGLAARLLSERPGLTIEEIRESLLKAAKSGVYVIVAAGNGPRERPRERPPHEFRPDEAERNFRGLGLWKSPQFGDWAREYWLASGAQEVQWLVRRLRSERHVEVLHDAAAILADLGRLSIGPILEELGNAPAPDQTSALLRALGWLGESHERPVIEGAQGELILADLLHDENPDVREAAARAMRLLRPGRAAHWLTRRRLVEPDAAVLDSIEEELGRYSSGQG